MNYEERKLDDNTISQLIELSKKWVDENCSWGIVANEKDDLMEPLFCCLDGENIVGYIFGHFEIQERKSSYIEKGANCFEIDELYVLPEYRKRGIGKELFRLLEKKVENECQYIMLSTSTKNYKGVLHFYIDELDMDFYSAFLIKKMK